MSATLTQAPDSSSHAGQLTAQRKRASAETKKILEEMKIALDRIQLGQERGAGNAKRMNKLKGRESALLAYKQQIAQAIDHCDSEHGHHHGAHISGLTNLMTDILHDEIFHEEHHDDKPAGFAAQVNQEQEGPTALSAVSAAIKSYRSMQQDLSAVCDDIQDLRFAINLAKSGMGAEMRADIEKVVLDQVRADAQNEGGGIIGMRYKQRMDDITAVAQVLSDPASTGQDVQKAMHDHFSVRRKSFWRKVSEFAGTHHDASTQHIVDEEQKMYGMYKAARVALEKKDLTQAEAILADEETVIADNMDGISGCIVKRAASYLKNMGRNRPGPGGQHT